MITSFIWALFLSVVLSNPPEVVKEPAGNIDCEFDKRGVYVCKP